MNNMYLRLILLVFITFSISFNVYAKDSFEDKARKILDLNKSSLVVVTTESNIKTVATGVELPIQTHQVRTLGVTIDNDGLLVVSNSAIDGSLGLEGKTVNYNNKKVSILSAKSEFSKIKLSYGDESNFDGKIISQNVTADIALILPVLKGVKKKFPKVGVSDFATEKDVNVADMVVGLSRTSSVFGFRPIISIGRITGIFKSKRTIFINTAGKSQGTPVFTPDGKLVGITVSRVLSNGKTVTPTGILGTLSAGSIQVIAELARKNKLK